MAEAVRPQKLPPELPPDGLKQAGNRGTMTVQSATGFATQLLTKRPNETTLRAGVVRYFARIY
jgi:hypothetical protein